MNVRKVIGLRDNVRELISRFPDKAGHFLQSQDWKADFMRHADEGRSFMLNIAGMLGDSSLLLCLWHCFARIKDNDFGCTDWEIKYLMNNTCINLVEFFYCTKNGLTPLYLPRHHGLQYQKW